jgi:hypothetical protein
MDKVYFFVSQLDGFVNDGWNFYSQYFNDEGGFLYSFLIALAVAVVMLTVFYGIICNKVFKLSKPIVWFVFLCLSTGITFFVTSSFIIGNNDVIDDSSGFYGSIEKSYIAKTNESGVDADAIRAYADSIIEQVYEGESEVASSLCTGNSIFSLIWFFLFSVLVKGFTRYGIAIPFVWPRKLHKSI